MGRRDDVATEVRRFAVTPEEAEELRRRADRDAGGHLTTLIRKALGLKPRRSGRPRGSTTGSGSVRRTADEQDAQDAAQQPASGDPMDGPVV